MEYIKISNILKFSYREKKFFNHTLQCFIIGYNKRVERQKRYKIVTKKDLLELKQFLFFLTYAIISIFIKSTSI